MSIDESVEAALAEYRLYLLDPVTGHIAGAETIYSADDIGAICLVQERVSDEPLELWCGQRKVRRFDGRPKEPRPSRMRVDSNATL